jgi:hypothetical protein
MTYTPDQMRGTAIDLEKYGVRWPDREMAAQLRQGADAVERVKALEDALRWYEKQSTDCLKITSDGEVARNLLDRDGGARASAALETKP